MNHAQKLQILTETIADTLVDVDLLSDSIDTHDLVTLIQTSPREAASALLKLLEEQRDCVNELERWRPSQTDLHGECRDLVNQLRDTVGEILEATDNQVTLDGDKVVIADYAKVMRDLREQRGEVRAEVERLKAELAKARQQRDELVKAATDFRDLIFLRDGRHSEDVLNEVLRTIAAKSPPPAPQRDELAELRIQRDELVARLLDWCRQGGRNLCPTPGSADTFGDGIRQAQRVVRNLIAAEQPKPADAVQLLRDAAANCTGEMFGEQAAVKPKPAGGA